jgi:hypothetical protein
VRWVAVALSDAVSMLMDSISAIRSPRRRLVAF